MSLRNVTIYVEPRTIKRLRLALVLYPRYQTHAETQVKTVLTTDALADTLLNESIDIEFPLVKDLEKALAKAEREFMEKNKK